MDLGLMLTIWNTILLLIEGLKSLWWVIVAKLPIGDDLVVVFEFLLRMTELRILVYLGKGYLVRHRLRCHIVLALLRVKLGSIPS